MKRALILGLFAAAMVGCNTDMWRQPKQAPLDTNEFFADRMGDRPLVPGTIARDHLREDEPYYTGIKDGKWLDAIPVPVTLELLKRGQERFNIYCTPCHGRLGDGEGMISHRGLQLIRPPGNYHTPRLRNMPVGHFYDVITNGYGAMFSYASRVEPQDRWAIVAYIRVLQLSQHTSASDADPADLQKAQAIATGFTTAAPEESTAKPPVNEAPVNGNSISVSPGAPAGQTPPAAAGTPNGQPR